MSCCGKGIKAAAHGAVGAAKALLGVGRAKEETIRARLDRGCRLCDHATKHPTKRTANGQPLVRTCALCHCLIMLKVRNADEAYPDGRWPAEISVNKREPGKSANYDGPIAETSAERI